MELAVDPVADAGAVFLRVEVHVGGAAVAGAAEDLGDEVDRAGGGGDVAQFAADVPLGQGEVRGHRGAGLHDPLGGGDEVRVNFGRGDRLGGDLGQFGGDVVGEDGEVLVDGLHDQGHALVDELGELVGWDQPELQEGLAEVELVLPAILLDRQQLRRGDQPVGDEQGPEGLLRGGGEDLRMRRHGGILR